MKKKSKKAKWQEALQIAKERREAKIKRERDRYIKLNTHFERIAWREKKDSFNGQCIKLEEKTAEEITRNLLKETGDIKGTFFSRRWAQ